jgi:hypothetical protein
MRPLPRLRRNHSPMIATAMDWIFTITKPYGFWKNGSGTGQRPDQGFLRDA